MRARYPHPECKQMFLAQSFQCGAQVFHTCRKIGVGGVFGCNAVEAVNDSGVIAAAERVADFDELDVEQLAAEEHRDLAGGGECFGPGFGLETIGSDAPFLCDRVLNDRNGQPGSGSSAAVAAEPSVVAAVANLVVERFGGDVDSDRAVPQGCVGEQLDDGSFQLANVRSDVFRDEANDVVRDRVLEVVELRLVLEDRDAELEIWRFDVGDHSPLKAADEPSFQAGDFRWWAVARDDDLAAGLVEGVERVEELVLSGFLAAEKLDVIDEQEIRLAVPAPEVVGRAALDRGDEFVGELLGADVGDASVGDAADDVVGDGLHEVRFAESGVAVQEERVVYLAGGLGGHVSGGGCELVRIADDKVLERVSMAQWRHISAIVLLWWPCLIRWRGNEQIHLRPRPALLADLEYDREGMAEGDRGVGCDEVGVFGIVPVRSELIGRTDHQRVAVKAKRLGRLEPGAKRLFRQVVARVIEKPRPGLRRSEGRK